MAAPHAVGAGSVTSAASAGRAFAAGRLVQSRESSVRSCP